MPVTTALTANAINAALGYTAANRDPGFGAVGSVCLFIGGSNLGVINSGSTFTGDGTVLIARYVTIDSTPTVQLGNPVPAGQVWRNLSGAAFVNGVICICQRVS